MIFVLLLIPLSVFSHVILDDVSTVEKSTFSLKTVCSKMVSHESPLIDVVSGTEIDCMGKKVDVSDFCDREMSADPYYIRAFVNRESKEVICHSGKKVLFKYLCVKLTDKKICNGEAKKNCLNFREKLAKRLDLVHFSQVKNEKGINQLNCFYEALPLNESFNGTL